MHVVSLRDPSLAVSGNVYLGDLLHIWTHTSFLQRLWPPQDCVIIYPGMQLAT